MKRTLAIILVVCIMACAVPLSALGLSPYGLNFISINDTFLGLSAFSYYSGGAYYVPASLFGNFGIYYTYFPESQTASLWNDQTQVYFDMANGSSYDSAGTTYSAQALFRGGAVYLPVAFVCSWFGLSWSYIDGNDYGSVLRIKSYALLSDSDFLAVSTQAMENAYNTYYGTSTPTQTPRPPEATASPTPSPSPSPSPSPTPEVVNRSSTSVCLCFIGLPDSYVLRILANIGCGAGFFLTEEDIKENPDTVRSLAVFGYMLGVFCESPEDFPAAADALAQTAYTAALALTCKPENAEACAEYAEKNSLIYWSCGISAGSEDGEETVPAAVLTSQLEFAGPRADVLISCRDMDSDAISAVLSYLIASKFTLAKVRETTAPGL